MFFEHFLHSTLRVVRDNDEDVVVGCGGVEVFVDADAVEYFLGGVGVL